MDARNALQRIVAILLIAAGACSGTVFAKPVHIYASDFNLPILDKPGPGSWMTEAAIEVPDHFTIDDLDVGITVTHTNVFDLQIFLLSPASTRICLNIFDFKDEFSVYPNYTNTVFDDEAQTPINQASAPFTGRFRPIEPFQLCQFDGEDAYGLWRLQIYDMFDWDTGTLDHFELIITTPEPATAILFTLGIAVITLFRPYRRPL
jgi:subtilisin-like proprotein convertase family protein